MYHFVRYITWGGGGGMILKDFLQTLENFQVLIFFFHKFFYSHAPKKSKRSQNIQGFALIRAVLMLI